jgi:hypothetical protein
MTSLHEKIAKLLRLADDAGATEAERLNAAGKAQNLMLKYAIQELDLEPEQRTDVTHADRVFRGPHEWAIRWRGSLLHSIAKANRCRTYRVGAKSNATTHHSRVIGTPDDIRFVLSLYDWLAPWIESEAQRELTAAWQLGEPGTKTNAQRAKWRASFAFGAAGRIGERLQEQADAHAAEQVRGTDLVLHTEARNESYLTGTLGVTLVNRPAARIYADAHFSGRDAGDRADLRPDSRVGASEQGQLA